MRSQFTTAKYPFKYWPGGAIGWCYPSSGPREIGEVVQTYSNDLEISVNNRKAGRMVRIDAGLNVIPGSPFRVTKRDYHEFSTLGDGVHVFERNFGACHSALSGPQFARFSSFTNGTFPASSASSFTTLESLGRKAISMVAPTGSAFSTSQFLGELREGFPNAKGLALSGQARARHAKAAGASYLGIEFAWKPLISEVEKFTNAVENGNAILDRYWEQSNRLLKRSYQFPDEFTTSVIDSGTGYYPVPNRADTWMFANSARLVTTSTMKKRRWFEGVFKYSLPDMDSYRGKYAGMRKRFGVELTPELLYELAPWSWAADWIGDSGTLASNMSLFEKDSLVMPWAFMMEETINSTTYDLFGVRYGSQTKQGASGRTHNFSQTFTTTVKQRIPASPYGFGLSWDGFTQRQLALLAAAGIQRA